jgi:hypothetical protein
MRTLVVTAANETLAPLLRGLIESMNQWQPRPFTDLACFDLGFAPETLEWVRGHATQVVEPGWDLPVAAKLRTEKSELRALTVRPFLPNYFPAYDAYLWIDADAWVQERFALEWFFAEAAEGALAVVPQVDRAYRLTSGIVGLRINRTLAYFGQAAASRVVWNSYFDSSVLALRADAPHWARWARSFRAGLAATKGELCCDQTALNHVLWTERLPVRPLPALCNWLCHLALPGFDPVRGQLCEPFAPCNPIGIVHLTGRTSQEAFKLPAAGSAPAVSLRFRGAREV